MASWLINMSFSLTVMDLAFCYIRFKLLVVALHSRRLALKVARR